MELSKAQSAAFEKIRRRGGGDQGISLTDDSVRALVAVVARDLGIPAIAGIAALDQRGFYDIAPQDLVSAGDVSALTAYERLLQGGPLDTDMYFLSCCFRTRSVERGACLCRRLGRERL